ncbi:MAG: tetratricopeptide repeat protein [Proteobacteria bacterium]|nr:tetratricopeptide repeat protein [Pseudomonadota bacterium]
MRPIVLQTLVALTALGTLSGCATAKRAKAPAEPTSKVAEAPLSKDDLDKRVEALSRFAAGVSEELRDQPDEAVEQFYKSVLADPSNEPLVIDVARRLIRKKQTDKAIDVLTRCAAQPGSSGMVDALLGIAQLQAGKSDLAIASSRRAITKMPKSFLGYQNLATVYLQTKRPKEALATLDGAAALPPPDSAFLIDLGEAYRNYLSEVPRDFETVKPKLIAVLDAAAKLEPRAQNLVVRLAELWSFAGEYKRAAELYTRMLDRLPNNALLRGRLLDLFVRANDMKAAQTQLDSLVREQPTNPRWHAIRGELAAELKEWDKAIECFQKAIQLGDRLPEIIEPSYFGLIGVHLNRDKPADALKVIEQARSKLKLSFGLEFYTALAYTRAKDYAESIKHFTAAELLAKRDDPERLTALFYFQVGTAYERHKDFKQAEAYFRQSLSISPDFTEALNYLGYMWAERGENLSEARGMIEKALKLEPDNAAFLDSMAWVLFKLNQPKQALEYQLKALKLQKEPDATLHDHLGDIYLALKQPAKAREQWEQSLAIEPNDVVQQKLKGKQ